ncbi:hypothetical protein F511_08864 [Dorcoceras hygrometricum]|uniref:Uncharacterized protein n=1 Tax=Dorcoceras hygrometricum TaxID=472368 RepID=A0A2Z7AM26_9LAMI|nr:hypothetical protein F511_08864 [Dorcoceras hygrometricum]
MGCPGQARTKPRTQNSRRNAATCTPDGGRTAAPATLAACGSYIAGVRRLHTKQPSQRCHVYARRRPHGGARHASSVWQLHCRRAAATVPACSGYSDCMRQLQCWSFFFWHKNVLKDPSLRSDTTVGDNGRSESRFPGAQRKFKICPEKRPRPETRILRQPALEGLTNLARTESPRHADRNKSNHVITGGGRRRKGWSAAVRFIERRGGAQELEARFPYGNRESSTCVTLNGSGIRLAVGPQPLWLRNRNFGLAQRIMVKRLATSPHDPLGITDSACKNQLVVATVDRLIRSTTENKSPSSVCTRKADGFCHGRILSHTKQVRSRGGGTAAQGRRRGREVEEGGGAAESYALEARV